MRARRLGVPLPEHPLPLVVMEDARGRRVLHRAALWGCTEDSALISQGILLTDLDDPGLARCHSCLQRRSGYGALEGVLWDVTCALSAHDFVFEHLRVLTSALRDGRPVEAWARLHLLEHAVSSAWGERDYLVSCWVSDLLDRVEDQIPALRSQVEDLGVGCILAVAGVERGEGWRYVAGERNGARLQVPSLPRLGDPQELLDAVTAAFGVAPGVPVYAVPTGLVPVLEEVCRGGVVECGPVDWNMHVEVTSTALLLLEGASPCTLLASHANAFQAALDIVRPVACA